MLILASGSPRRRELLTQMGLTFTVRPVDANEQMPSGPPRDAVMAVSARKAALAAAAAAPDDVILAADTIVVLDGQILGKPASAEEAASMLSALSGTRHGVFTGVTVRHGAQAETACCETLVSFRPLDPMEIAAYVASGEPMDKAGAYGIQGLAALFVESLSGDYFNVVGLPICLTGGLLRRAGIPVLEVHS